MERALLHDLLPALPALLPVRIGARVGLVDVSMGGAGTLRLLLAFSERFCAAILLSPAVYVPEPPTESTARTAGACRGPAGGFDPERYRSLSYPAAVGAYRGHPTVRIVVAAGDDEPAGADDKGGLRSLTDEAHNVQRHLSAADGVRSRIMISPGGHDWRHWRRSLHAALPDIGPILRGEEEH